MSLGAVWDIGMLLGGISGSGLTTWLVVSYKLGKRAKVPKRRLCTAHVSTHSLWTVVLVEKAVSVSESR